MGFKTHHIRRKAGQIVESVVDSIKEVKELRNLVDVLDEGLTKFHKAQEEKTVKKKKTKRKTKKKSKTKATKKVASKSQEEL